MKKGNNTISSVFKGGQVIDKIMKGTLKVYESWKNLIASGVPPLTLTKCKGKGKLPSEYQQVEYIEGTGTQYFEIDYIATGDTISQGKYQITNTQSGKMLFGSRQSSSQNFYGFNWGGGLPYKYYNSYGSGVLTNVNIDDGVHTFKKDKGYLYRDGVLINSTNYKSFTTPSKMIVFGASTAGVIGLQSEARIFNLQFYDDDVLRIDLIPCYRKLDNEIGMYDLVNGVFYSNEGTGTFLKGENLPDGVDLIDYKIEGNSVQEADNLYNQMTFVTGQILIDGVLSTNANYNVSDFLEVKPNTTYISRMLHEYQTQTGSLISCACYDENKNYISNLYQENRMELKTYEYEFTIPSNAKYIRVSYRVSDTDIDFCQKTPTPEAPVEVESVGEYDETTGKYKIPVKISGKNFVPYPYQQTTKTVDGITFTDNGDGTITANGTAGANAVFYCHQWSDADVPAGTYHFRGQPLNYTDENGNRIANVSVALRKDGVKLVDTGDYGKGQTFTIDGADHIYIGIRINSGMTAENLTFKPQLELGTFSTEYEPYVEPITTNIYLNEPLRKIGDYADYIDFENQKVVRNIEKRSCGELEWYQHATYKYIYVFNSARIQAGTNPMSEVFNSTLYQPADSIKNMTTNFCIKAHVTSSATYVSDSVHTTEEEFIEFVKDKTIYYPLKTPIEETIELPNIPTFKGTTIIDVDTEVSPDAIEITYKGRE